MDLLLRQFVEFGFIFYLIMALGQLFMARKQLKNYVMSGLFICLAAMEFANLNTRTNLSFALPSLAFIDVPFIFAIGPLINILIKESMHNDFESGDRHLPYWVHFILPALAFTVCLPGFLDNGAATQGRIFHAFRTGTLFNIGDQKFEETLFIIAVFLNAAYIGWFFFNIRSLLNLTIIRSERSVQILLLILIFAFLICLSGTLALLFKIFAFLRIGAVLIATVAVVIYLLNQRIPTLMHDFTIALQQSKYRKSHLSNINLENISARLDELIRFEKIYRDEELSLSKLAQMLELSPNQASQFLNQHLEISFKEFINRNRIQEAAEILRTDSDISISRLAFEVGFKSISSFNAKFKEITGSTAKDFRRDSTKKVDTA